MILSVIKQRWIGQAPLNRGIILSALESGYSVMWWGAQRTLQEGVSDDQGSPQTSSGGVYGLQPPRLLCPWNSPAKNNGVGCHFLLRGILACYSIYLCLSFLICKLRIIVVLFFRIAIKDKWLNIPKILILTPIVTLQMNLLFLLFQIPKN